MVLAAGCIEISMGFSVDSDGSGSYEMEMEFSQELLQMATAFSDLDSEQDGSEEAAREACDEMLSESDFDELPWGDTSLVESGVEFEVHEISDDSNCGARMRVAWPGELADLVFTSLREDEGPDFHRVGTDGWSFAMPLDLGEEELMGDSGFGEMMDLSFEVNVTLPGNPVEHNADRVSSGCNSSTFFWDIDIFDPPELMAAESDGKGDCGGGWGAGLIVTVVILGVLVVAMVAAALIIPSRRRRAQPAPPPPTDPQDE